MDARQPPHEERAPQPPDESPLLLHAGADSVCGVTIGDIAVYQSVKSLLVHDGVEVRKPEVELVQRRPALMRVFLTLGAGWKAGEVQGSLTIAGKAGRVLLRDQRRVATPSSDAALDSTLDFDIPGDALVDGASYAVDLTPPAGCAAVRYPTTGYAPLRSRYTGRLKIKLVPIRYAADHSMRLPDVSDNQRARMRARLLALYPVQEVELSVRAAVTTKIAVTGTPEGWNALLDSLRALRAADDPDPDVFYFGLVSPAESQTAYCPDQCLLGLSFRTDQPAATYQAGLGLGFSGELAVSVLAHEMGHLAGRKHAPCKTTSYLDPLFPQRDGKTGSWGWDGHTRTLYSPDATRDLMGYCSPAWISAYTYQGVMSRLAEIAGATKITSTLEVPQAGRTLLIGPQGARWGLPVAGAPAGVNEDATVLDEEGKVVGNIGVWRAELGEEGESSLQIPARQPGWHSLQLAGLAPIPFDGPGAVPALEP